MQKQIWKTIILLHQLIFVTGDYLFSSLPESIEGDTLLRKKIEIKANDSMPKKLGYIRQELSKYVKIQVGIKRRQKPILVDRVYSKLDGQFINIDMIIPVEIYDSRMDRLINLGARFRHHVDLETRFEIFATFSISTLAGKGFASNSTLSFYFGQGSMAREMFWTIDFETLLKNEVKKSLGNLIPNLERVVADYPFREDILVGIPGAELGSSPEGISEFALGQLPPSVLPKPLASETNFSISGSWYFEVDIRPYGGKYGTSRVKIYLELIEENHSIRVNGQLKIGGRDLIAKMYLRKEMQRLLFRELHKYEVEKAGWKLVQGKENSPYYLQIYSDNFEKNEFYEIHPLGNDKIRIRTWIHKRIDGKPKWPFQEGSLRPVDIIAIRMK